MADEPQRLPGDPFGPSLTLDQVQSGTARNVAVTTLTKAVLQLISLGTLLLLARLLAPADFGVVAMVASVLGIAELFRDMGLSAATMRVAHITREQINTLFWINVGIGAAFMLLGLALAPLLPDLLSNPRAGAIAAALSVNFLINGLAAQHLALLRRGLRFPELARISLMTSLAGSGVALALAFGGAAYWALVGSTLTSSVLLLAGAWRRSGFTPSAPAFDPSVKPMIAFGGNLVVFGLLGYLAQNLQNVLLGRYRGAAAAGLYSRASALMNLPMAYALEPLRTIAPATMARLGEGSDAWRDYYLVTLRGLLLMVAPASACLALLAPDVIAVLLGPRWLECGPILRWLALGMLPQAICSTSGWLYMSRGDSRGMMRWGMFGWTVVIVAMLCGLPAGATGVAAMYTLSLFLIVAPCMHYACRGSVITLRSVGALTWRPALAALIAGLLGAALLPLLEDWPAPLRIVAIGCAVCATDLALLLTVLRMRTEVTSLWHTVRGLVRPGARA